MPVYVHELNKLLLLLAMQQDSFSVTIILIQPAFNIFLRPLPPFLPEIQVSQVNVLNRFLHVHTGGRAYRNAHFGAGHGPIFLDDVQCSSSSSQLLECPSRMLLSHNCLHSADAGVGCEGVF